MGFYNSGGLITRGYGDDHRIITRGMSVRFDLGGIGKIPGIKKSKENIIKIFAPKSKERFGEFKIYTPLGIEKNGEISINSDIFKKIIQNFNIKSKVNSTKLFEILDEI